jgi:hypothetical protein
VNDESRRKKTNQSDRLAERTRATDDRTRSPFDVLRVLITAVILAVMALIFYAGFIRHVKQQLRDGLARPGPTMKPEFRDRWYLYLEETDRCEDTTETHSHSSNCSPSS